MVRTRQPGLEMSSATRSAWAAIVSAGLSAAEAGEEARVDHVEVVVIPGAAIRVQCRGRGIGAEADGAALVRGRVGAERLRQHDRETDVPAAVSSPLSTKRRCARRLLRFQTSGSRRRCVRVTRLSRCARSSDIDVPVDAVAREPGARAISALRGNAPPQHRLRDLAQQLQVAERRLALGRRRGRSR